MSHWLTDPQQLLLGLQLGGVGVWRWRIGTEDLEWTQNLEDIHQMKAGYFDRTLSSFRRDLHAQDAESVWQAISRSIETGEPYAVVYRSVGGANNTQPIWIEAKGGVVRSDDGEDYLTGVCLDVSARIVSENELSRRLRQQEGIQQLSSYALGPVSFADVLQRTVETAAHVFDAPLTKVLQFVDSADELRLVAGVGWPSGLLGSATVAIDNDSQAGFTLISPSPVIVTDLTTETRFSGPPLLSDHGVRSGMSVVIRGSSERPFGVFGIHTREPRVFDGHDVDALISISNIVAQSARQNEAGQQQRLILREMAHRSGNLLQVILSIAAQTFRAQADPQIALQSFTGRLESISRANHLITRRGWGPTRLLSLIDEVLGAYTDRLKIDGRDIQLPADLAFDLGLVLYELATNSLKYGSLSTHTGTIDLSWRIDKSGGASSLAMEWRDGHKIAKQVRGTGFGSKLKRALVEQKWRGSISVTADDSYRFSCCIPLPEAAIISDEDTGAAGKSSTAPDPLNQTAS